MLAQDRGDPVDHLAWERRQFIYLGTEGGMFVRSSRKGPRLGKLDAPIRHVRNIREHWDENRPFWSAGRPIPLEPKYVSARWFKTNFPDKTPWSSSWSNVEGPVVCGVIHLNELLVILDQVGGLIAQESG